MLEMALAAVFVTVALVAIGGRSAPVTDAPALNMASLLEESSDLPCPWCRAQTHESDDHCPTCGQKFG